MTATSSITPANTPALAESGFLRLPGVRALIPVGRSTWWLWVKQGKAPRPVKLGPGVTAWRTSDILQFIRNHNGDAQARVAHRRSRGDAEARPAA